VEGPESPESPGRLKNDLPPAEKFSLGISRTTGLVVSPIVCLPTQLHILHPASRLMKANLRINFKRICFDAKISRQRGRTKKRERK